MLESIGQIGLGIVLGFVLNHLFLPFYKEFISHKFEKNKNQDNHNLQLERELLYKDLEFEKIKLERVLPELENINNILYEHRMMFNTYLYWIINKCGNTKEIEEERVELDKKIIISLSKVSLYIPMEFRLLINSYRKLISCSWISTQTVSNTLRETGEIEKILSSAHDLYDDISAAFYEMNKNFLGLVKKTDDYSLILTNLKLKLENSQIKTLREDIEYQIAWKTILFHEYYGSAEKLELLEKVKQSNKE